MNWRERLERLRPRCLEMFVPPKYAEGQGLVELRKELEQMAQHPVARALELASCHFPWGESANGYSRYNLADDQYFYPFIEIATILNDFRSDIGLPPERCALNFHNLYELPRLLLEKLRSERKLAAVRGTLLAHARNQTLTAQKLLDIVGLPLTLVNENNPPIGDGDRMSIVDVFAEDLATRATELHTRTCMDLSHVFMTRFHYGLPQSERPSFPYLEHESREEPNPSRRLDFDEYLERLRPLYFHVSDTKGPGARREFEGLPIGKGDTPWTDVLPAMARYASRNDNRLFMVIEIKGGHTAEGLSLCEESERELIGIIEDCFASGFLEAIS